MSCHLHTVSYKLVSFFDKIAVFCWRLHNLVPQRKLQLHRLRQNLTHIIQVVHLRWKQINELHTILIFDLELGSPKNFESILSCRELNRAWQTELQITQPFKWTKSSVFLKQTCGNQPKEKTLFYYTFKIFSELQGHISPRKQIKIKVSSDQKESLTSFNLNVIYWEYKWVILQQQIVFNSCEIIVFICWCEQFFLSQTQFEPSNEFQSSHTYLVYSI